jgi:hypothetical protein
LCHTGGQILLRSRLHAAATECDEQSAKRIQIIVLLLVHNARRLLMFKCEHVDNAATVEQ